MENPPPNLTLGYKWRLFCQLFYCPKFSVVNQALAPLSKKKREKRRDRTRQSLAKIADWRKYRPCNCRKGYEGLFFDAWQEKGQLMIPMTGSSRGRILKKWCNGLFAVTPFLHHFACDASKTGSDGRTRTCDPMINSHSPTVTADDGDFCS